MDQTRARRKGEGLGAEIGQSFYLLALTVLVSGAALSVGLMAVWALG